MKGERRRREVCAGKTHESGEKRRKGIKGSDKNKWKTESMECRDEWLLYRAERGKDI